MVRKPQRQVFSWWGSYSICIIPTCIASISEIPVSFYSWADRFESCLVTQFWRQVLSWCGSDFSLTAELREKKEVSIIWASVWQNQQNYLCAQRRRRSAWASTQSDQSLLYAWRNLGSLPFHWVQSKDWSDWADSWADLSLCWAHRSFCWFCCAAALLSIVKPVLIVLEMLVGY